MSLVDRAKNIVLTPKSEWIAIDREPSTIRDIYSGYVVPLALVPVIAGFIGTSVIGMNIPGLGLVRIGVLAGIATAVLQFALSLGLVYVLALIIEALAPSFGGWKNRVAAFKAAAYSMTPMWLAGIFSVYPPLSFLVLVGLYGVYVLYLGLPRLMRAAPEKAGGYTGVVVASAFVLSFVLMALVALLTGRSFDL